MKKPPLGTEGLPPPWAPPDYRKEDALAIQACVLGTANADQQKRAINWIVMTCADTYGFSYRQNDRDHAFADGRRFVGQEIVKLMKLKISLLDMPKPKGDANG